MELTPKMKVEDVFVFTSMNKTLFVGRIENHKGFITKGKWQIQVDNQPIQEVEVLIENIPAVLQSDRRNLRTLEVSGIINLDIIDAVNHNIELLKID